MTEQHPEGGARRASTTATFYVALQHDQRNLSVLAVTPLDDGMELVEYVGTAGYNLPADVEEVVVAARGTARATGSREATYDNGRGIKVRYYANRWGAPLHRM